MNLIASTLGAVSKHLPSFAARAPRGSVAMTQSQCLTTLCGALRLVFHEQHDRFT